jgi:hypothetical protein
MAVPVVDARNAAPLRTLPLMVADVDEGDGDGPVGVPEPPQLVTKIASAATIARELRRCMDIVSLGATSGPEDL